MYDPSSSSSFLIKKKKAPAFFSKSALAFVFDYLSNCTKKKKVIITYLYIRGILYCLGMVLTSTYEYHIVELI